MNTKIKLNLLAGAFALLGSTSASAALILPEVELCGAFIQSSLSGGLNNLMCLKGTVTGDAANTSGTYIASSHDEFLSYSIEALETIQKQAPSMLPIAVYGEWSKLVSGSGQLDVGALIKASGSGVLNNYDPFPDAASSNTNETDYQRTWGGNTGTDTNDAGADVDDPILTVAEVVSWLNPETLPAFYFDLADPQNAVGDLFFSGRIYVTDATGAVVLDTWSFDNIFNGEFDINSLVMAPKDVPVFIPGSGCTDYVGTLGADWCNISNSRGSGSPEFIAYAPTMDLAKWAVDGNLFWANFRINSNEAADEELYMTRRVGTTVVPEPGALALMGMGLLVLSLIRRRKGF